MREFTGEAPQAAVPLKPHKYPVWIICFAALVGCACAYASLSLPHNFATAHRFAEANRIDRTGDHAAAVPLYREVFDRSPKSRTARLALARAMFADGNPANDLDALKLLVGLHLTDSEWSEIQPVMPEQYRQLFVREKV